MSAEFGSAWEPKDRIETTREKEERLARVKAFWAGEPPPEPPVHTEVFSLGGDGSMDKLAMPRTATQVRMVRAEANLRLYREEIAALAAASMEWVQQQRLERKLRRARERSRA